MTDFSTGGALSGPTAPGPVDTSTDTSQDLTTTQNEDTSGLDENGEPLYNDTNTTEDPGETITLKVNGKEISKPMTEVIKLAQQAIAAGNIMEKVKAERADAQKGKQELNSMRTAVNTLVGLFEKGDFGTVADLFHQKAPQLGQAFEKGAIQYALKLYQLSQMAPDAREAHDAKRELERMRKENQTRTQREAKQQHEYHVNTIREQITKELPVALKQVGLPHNRVVTEYVLSTWKTAIERGQSPTLAAVAGYCKERMTKDGIIPTQTTQAQPNYTNPNPAPFKRRTATPESVGARNNAEPEAQYMSMSDWKKSRTVRR